MENHDTFHYTYSAKQQEEIQAIRRKYAAPTEDAMTLLRRLDAGVTQKAGAAALTVGIIGTLLLGGGMSLIMTELGVWLGLTQPLLMLIGIAVGIVGIALACAAYPLYHRVLARERKKIAPTILRLTDELMQ